MKERGSNEELLVNRYVRLGAQNVNKVVTVSFLVGEARMGGLERARRERKGAAFTLSLKERYKHQS